MQLLNDILHHSVMPDEITFFLDSLLEKIKRSQAGKDGFSSLRFEELYGIIPGTIAARHGRESTDVKMQNAIVQWNLSEILTLKNPWDGMTAAFWKQDGHYYCMAFHLFEKQWHVSTEPAINAREAEEFFPIAVRRLQLLASAFGNTPLRQLGIRRYVFDVLTKEKDKTLAQFYLEFFLTLFQLDLTCDELRNQDLFLKRARLHCEAIISQRAQCGVRDDFSQLGGCAAMHGCAPVFDALYVPINMIWGFLANRKIMRELEMPLPGKFCFQERYDSKGNIELGEVMPVTDGKKSSFQFYRDRDCYTQVFPDYQTALVFHQIAAELLKKTQRRKEV